MSLRLDTVRRARLGDVYLFRTETGLPLEGYVSGDYVQAGDALRAHRYGPLGAIPLHEKAIVKVSVQGGCPFRCRPCDAGSAGFFGNATAQEISAQFDAMVADKDLTQCAKLKLHLSKLGEPALNWDASHAALLDILRRYPHLSIVPTVTTMPRETAALDRLLRDMLALPAGLTQTKISMGATSERVRRSLFGAVLDTASVGRVLDAAWPERGAEHRITLTYLAVPGEPFDADYLLSCLPESARGAVTVEVYKVNPTVNALRHDLTGALVTYRDSGPYEAAMARLRDAGVRTYFSAPSNGEQWALVANGSSLLLNAP